MQPLDDDVVTLRAGRVWLPGILGVDSGRGLGPLGGLHGLPFRRAPLIWLRAALSCMGDSGVSLSGNSLRTR